MMVKRSTSLKKNHFLYEDEFGINSIINSPSFKFIERPILDLMFLTTNYSDETTTGYIP
jgi:hypothetical protein